MFQLALNSVSKSKYENQPDHQNRFSTQLAKNNQIGGK